MAGHQLKEAGQGLLRGHSVGAQGLKRLNQLSVLAGPDVGRNLLSVKQDSALPGGESLAGTPEGGKPREQPASLGEASPAGEFHKVPSLNILSSQCRPAGNTWRHHSQDLCHSNTMDLRATKRRQRRRGQATQRSPSKSVTTMTVLISWRSLPTARCPSYKEAFLTDIAHQTDEAESVVEYACAATNFQMYLAREETKVLPNNFEEATIIGSRWVYKINAEKFIGQPRLMSTALEHPSPLRRGIAISNPEKWTMGNEPMSMEMPNIDDRHLVDRIVDSDKRSTGTDEIKNGAMNHEKGVDDEGDPQEGKLRSWQRRDEVRRKSDSGHYLRFFLALSYSNCSMGSAL